MTGLESFRNKYPQYGDMPDEQLADALHAKFYSDIPRDQYLLKLGIGTKAIDTAATTVAPSGVDAASIDPMTGEGATPTEAPTDQAPFFGPGGTIESLPEQSKLSMSGFINGLPNLMKGAWAQFNAAPSQSPQDLGLSPKAAREFAASQAASEVQADPAFARRRDVGAGISQDLATATPKNQGLPGEVASSVVQSAPPLLAGVATGLINPALGVAVGVGGGSAQQAQQSYDQTGEITFALRQGLYEGLGEAAGMKAILAPAKTLLGHVIKAAATEFGQEAATQLTQDIDDRLTHNPEMTLGEIVQDPQLWHNALVAGTSGVVMAGAAAPVVHLAQKANENAFNNQMEEIARQDMERTLARRISPDDVAWRLLQVPQGATPLAPGSFGPGVEFPSASPVATAVDSPTATASNPTIIPTPPPGVFTSIGVDPKFVSNPYIQFNELGEQLVSYGAQLLTPIVGATTALDEVNGAIDQIAQKTQVNGMLSVAEASKVAQDHINSTDITLVHFAENYLNRISQATSTVTRELIAQDYMKKLQAYSSDLVARTEGKTFAMQATTRVGVWANVGGQIVYSDTATDIGTQFDGMTTLPAGKVIAVGQAVKPEVAKAAATLVQKWVKQFGLNMGIIIAPGSDSYVYGSASLDYNGNAIIQLNYDKLIDSRGKMKARFAETLAHELGHIIGSVLFKNSSKDIQAAIIKAWNEDNTNALDMTIKDFLTSRRGPAWMSGDQSSYYTTVREYIAHEYGTVSRGAVRDYYMNFDEWMAHNFERILAGDVYRWQSPMRRFMQEVFIKFKALFESYKREFAPNETFKKFLDYHIARNQSQLLAQKFNAIETALAAQPGAFKAASIDADAARSAQELVLGTEPEEVGNRIQSLMNSGEHEEGGAPMTTEGHVEWSKIKRLSYTLLQVAKLNPDMKALYDPLGVRDNLTGEVKKGYIDNVLLWAAERMSWMSRADEWLHGARSLSRAEQGALSQFSFAQVISGKFLDGNDMAVRQQYKLTDAVVDQYNKMTAMFQSFLTAMEETLRAEALKRLAKNPFAVGELQSIKKRFDALRAQPYAPMVRYGEFVTKVFANKDMVIDGQKYSAGDTIYREHFDTKRQRNKAQAQIQGMFPSGTLVHDILPEDIRSMAGMPGALLDAMKDKLGLTDEQRTKLQQYIYEIAPAQSFVKRLMQRRGILGYSFDLQRGFANYFFHGANHIARVKYNDSLLDARTRLHADTNAKAKMGGDVTNAREVENYLARHFDYIMNPKNDWAALRGVVAISYLGGIIKTALMNMTQVPLATFPHLAERYGDVAAIQAIKKAYSDQFKAYRILKPMGAEQQAAMNKWVQGQALSPNEEAYIRAWTGMDAAKRDDLLRAQRENTIDQSQAMELAAMSEGQWLSRFKATDELGYYARAFGQAIMIPFQLAEKLNRRVTFMAAHDLATKEGLVGEERYQAAKAVVDTTQLNYDKWNRPEMLRGKKGVFMMFMQYNLGMLHLGTNGFSGNVAKWNWRWWALMLAAGGVLGLPFAENLIDLAEWALLKLYPNERINIKHELKKLVGELMGNMQAAPDIFLHGLSRYGFGVLPFADMSGSISMGRMIPGTDVLLSSAEGASWNDALAKAVTEAGGASSSLVLRMMQMLASNDPDTWRRVEKGLPMTAMQNVSAALRWYQRGGEETGKGGNIVKFDASDPWQAAEMIAKSQGFTPQRLAETREDLYIKQDMARYYQIRKGMLLNGVDEARQHGDTEAVTKAIEAVREFNKEVPIRALGITGDELRKSLLSREKARALQDEGEGTTKTEKIVTHAINSGAL